MTLIKNDNIDNQKINTYHNAWFWSRRIIFATTAAAALIGVLRGIQESRAR
jgi:hypothetical protein